MNMSNLRVGLVAGIIFLFGVIMGAVVMIQIWPHMEGGGTTIIMDPPGQPVTPNPYPDQPLPNPDRPYAPGTPSTACGMMNPHGLDITCGWNPPSETDLMYAIGDGCRQHANCQERDGKCVLVKTTKFDSCKSCVEQCLSTSKDDSMKLSQCESACTSTENAR